MTVTYDVLIDLPGELICSILLKWLDWKHVPSIDSAYCNKSKRPELLAVFSCAEFILPGIDFRNDNFLKWIYHRNVRAEKIVMWCKLKPFLAEYCAQFGRSVKSIQLVGTLMSSDNNSNLCAMMINACINLEKLEFYTCSISLEVLATIANHKSLKILNTNGKCVILVFMPLGGLDERASTLNLHTLDLNNADDVGNKHAELLQVTHLENLTRLRVRWENGRSTKALMSKFADCVCANLEALSILPQGDFTDAQAISILQSCPNLIYLDLNCWDLTVACVPYIAALSRLRAICLYESSYNSALLQQLANSHRETLEAVYINERGCFPYNDIFLFENLLEKCVNVRTLCIMHADDNLEFDTSLLCDITTFVVHYRSRTLTYLKHIAADCESVKFLGIVDCDMDGADITVFDSLPKLRTLHFFRGKVELACTMKSALYKLMDRRPELTIRYTDEFDLFKFESGHYENV